MAFLLNFIKIDLNIKLILIFSLLTISSSFAQTFSPSRDSAVKFCSTRGKVLKFFPKLLISTMQFPFLKEGRGMFSAEDSKYSEKLSNNIPLFSSSFSFPKKAQQPFKAGVIGSKKDCLLVRTFCPIPLYCLPLASVKV